MRFQESRQLSAEKDVAAATTQAPSAIRKPTLGGSPALELSDVLHYYFSHWDMQENSSLSVLLSLLPLACHGCAAGEQQQQGTGSWAPAPGSGQFWGPLVGTSLHVPAVTTGKVFISAAESRREPSSVKGRDNWYPRASLLLRRKHCLPSPQRSASVFLLLLTGMLWDLYFSALCGP